MKCVSLLLLMTFLLVACNSTEETTTASAPGSGLEGVGSAPMVSEEEVPEQELLDPNRIVARVNDEIITVRSIQAEYGDALLTIGEPTDARYRQALDRFALDMIIGRLFLQAAERLGVDITEQDLERMVKEAEEQLKKRDTTLDEDLRSRGVARWEWEEEQRKKLVIQKYFNIALGREGPSSPELRPLVDFYVRPMEVRGYYQRNIEKYQQDEQAKVGAIFIRVADFEQPGVDMIEARDAAKAYASLLLARARGGEDFAQLVDEAHGGPLSAFEKPVKRSDQQLDFVRNFIWDAEVGDISDLNMTPAGFVVLKLEDYHTARVLPYDEAKADINIQIQYLKFTAAQLKVQLSLLKESVVEPAAFKRELKRRFQAQTEEVLDALSI